MRDLRQIRLEWALFLAMGLVFLLAGLGNYDLSAPDEPRFALVAREMLQDGHWLLPHRNGHAYPDKPPLFFWSIAFFSWMLPGGVTALSARLPSALSALIVALLMWRWADRERRGGLLYLFMPLVLVSSSGFMYRAHMAQIDMLLCLCVTSAMLLGYRALNGMRYSPFWLGFWMGLGILAKGPVGYLIPAGAFALYCLFKGRESWRYYPRKALLWGLLPPLIWLAGLTVQVWVQDEWAYFYNLLFKQTLVRYVNPWHHYKPFYYFLTVVLYDFLPWWPLLLAAVPWRKAARQALNNHERFAWAVVVFTLLFFSLSKGKRNLYILPIYPFAAYLVFAYLVRLKEQVQSRLAPSQIALAGSSLIMLVAAGAMVWLGLGKVDVAARTGYQADFPAAWFLMAGLVMSGSLIFGLVQWYQGRWRGPVCGMSAAMGVLALVFYLVALPWISPRRSARDFMEKVNGIIAAQSRTEPVVGMVQYRSAYRFYGNYPLVELTPENDPQLAHLPGLEAFWQEHPQGWAIVRDKQMKEFAANHPQREYEIVHQELAGEDDLFLLVRPTKPKRMAP